MGTDVVITEGWCPVAKLMPPEEAGLGFSTLQQAVGHGGLDHLVAEADLLLFLGSRVMVSWSHSRSAGDATRQGMPSIGSRRRRR